MAEGGTRRDTEDIHGGSGHTGQSTSEERSFRSEDCTVVLGAPSCPHPLRFSDTLLSGASNVSSVEAALQLQLPTKGDFKRNIQG